MQLCELRPRDRKHFRRRVQLHRAGAERDHRSRERKIARLQTAEVAEHFRFSVMRVEDGMSEEGGIAACGFRKPESFFARLLTNSVTFPAVSSPQLTN